jgi:hypothetical protein
MKNTAIKLKRAIAIFLVRLTSPTAAHLVAHIAREWVAVARVAVAIVAVA